MWWTNIVMSWFDFDDSRKNKNKKLANVTPTTTNQANSHVNSSADNHNSDTLLKLLQTNCYILNLCLRTVNIVSVQAVNSHIQECGPSMCWAMAASSSAVSDQASAIAKNVITSQQAESLQQAIHIPGSINQRNSHHNSAPLLPSPVSSLQNLTNNASADLSSTNYNCANCDIKFDSESSLRVHLQVSSIVSIYIYRSTTVQ